MSARPSPVRASYAKSAIACAALFVMALLASVAALQWVPGLPGAAVAALSALFALVGATLFSACTVVLARHSRSVRGERDLFLELNESREPAAIEAAGPTMVSGVRRWLAQRLLGHDLVVGDLVEIRSWPEVRATLDEKGCLEQLPFMPEMLRMCGQRAYVFRCMHRLFDYRKTRRMRHMHGAVLLVGIVCDGSSHGGCEAACHTVWKSAWLKRIEPRAQVAAIPEGAANTAESTSALVSSRDAAVLQFGTTAPRFVCQLTQLNAASRSIGNWSPINFIRPLISGNVAPGAFAVGWLTDLFNDFQQLRKGTGFPDFEVPLAPDSSGLETHLEPGDPVLVRSSGEIRATLNDQFVHRGLGFESDMLKHCGRRCFVQSEVRKLVDIVTGEMRIMKTPAYILRDVHFSGERQQFNAQYEPLFWRGVWLCRGRDRVEGNTADSHRLPAENDLQP